MSAQQINRLTTPFIGKYKRVFLLCCKELGIIHLKMKLLSNFINELIETDKTISSPILKAKVFASRIQNKELLNWLNKELNGYSTIGELPKYRVHKCLLTGS